MNIELLTKSRTEQLECDTVPIEAITGYQDPYMRIYFKINSWYKVHGLTTSSPQKKFVEKLSELLGCGPLYYKKYEYRTVVWGFKWQDQEFILYRSERGLSIQILNSFKNDMLVEFLDQFAQLLKVDSITTPYD